MDRMSALLGCVVMTGAIAAMACSSPSWDCPPGCDCETPKAAKSPCITGVKTCYSNFSPGGCQNGFKVNDFPDGCKENREQFPATLAYVPTNCSSFSAQCSLEYICVADDARPGWCANHIAIGGWNSGAKKYEECCDDD